VARCPSIVECLLISGDDDYLLTVLARDIEDFEHVHKGQLSTLPRVARIHSSFAIREVIGRRAPPTALERLRRRR
jgi:DNA-binding Lrp family transcriptional regulator